MPLTSEHPEARMARGSAGKAKGKRKSGVANVTHTLKGIGFPATKWDLLNRAQKNQAERAVLDISEQCRVRITGPWRM